MGLLREFYFCCVRLTKCCSQVIFHFLVTYSARLLFHFCVADLKAIQYVRNQPVPNFGRQDLLSKVRTFIFERVLFIPSEASKECLKIFFVFSTLIKKNNNK